MAQTDTNVQIGGVYRLRTADKSGAKYVHITERNGSIFTGWTGKVRDGEFTRKTFTLNDRPVRKLQLQAIQLGDFITTEDFVPEVKGQNTMSNKQAATQGETVVELDPDAIAEADAATATPRVKTAEEQIKAIEDAAKEKKRKIQEAEDAKKKAATDKQVEKLTAAATKAGLKEAEAAEQYSAGRTKRFKDLTKDETGVAIDGMKETAKQKKKDDAAAEKNVKTLTDLVGKAGVKEAEIAAEFSAERGEGNAVKKFTALTPVEATAAIEALKERAKKKVKDDALALKSNLSADEEKELGTLEKTVEKFLPQFQNAGFQIGAALTIINQKRLYRATRNGQGEPCTFAEYVGVRFDLSRPHAYTVMAAAQTFEALSEGETFNAKDMPSITAAEAIHRGVQGLVKAANIEDDPELAAITRQISRNVYNLAVQNAPTDKEGKAILSPSHIASTFSVLSEVAKSGVVEMDGKAIPLNLAAASMDEMITDESTERVMRAKQFLSDEIAKRAEATAGQKGSKLTEALNSVTGSGVAIPAGVTPKITVICSVHGRVALEDTTDSDIKLGCGCAFVKTPDGYLFDETLKG